jgi:hypothetical protein
MLSNSGLADIVALADLISSAVKDVVAEYTSAQVSMPSLSSTSMGPFDIPESMPSNLIKAIRTVEAACTQLTFSVANPGLVVCQKAYGVWRIYGYFPVIHRYSVVSRASLHASCHGFQDRRSSSG